MSGNVTLKKGDVLIREGEESNSLFYIQSGTLDVFKVIMAINLCLFQCT